MNEFFGKKLSRKEQKKLMDKFNHKFIAVDESGSMKDFRDLMKSKKTLHAIKMKLT